MRRGVLMERVALLLFEHVEFERGVLGCVLARVGSRIGCLRAATELCVVFDIVVLDIILVVGHPSGPVLALVSATAHALGAKWLRNVRSQRVFEIVGIMFTLSCSADDVPLALDRAVARVKQSPGMNAGLQSVSPALELALHVATDAPLVLEHLHLLGQLRQLIVELVVDGVDVAHVALVTHDRGRLAESFPHQRPVAHRLLATRGDLAVLILEELVVLLLRRRLLEVIEELHIICFVEVRRDLAEEGIALLGLNEDLALRIVVFDVRQLALVLGHVVALQAIDDALLQSANLLDAHDLLVVDWQLRPPDGLICLLFPARAVEALELIDVALEPFIIEGFIVVAIWSQSLHHFHQLLFQSLNLLLANLNGALQVLGILFSAWKGLVYAPN